MDRLFLAKSTHPPLAVLHVKRLPPQIFLRYNEQEEQTETIAYFGGRETPTMPRRQLRATMGVATGFISGKR
jgi:hypothetical protein